MAEVRISFTPEFRARICDGIKTCTTRMHKHGEPGDTFWAFGNRFVLTDVKRVPLGLVASQYYRQEGFDTADEFVHAWKCIYPEQGYDPQMNVWLHMFRRLNHD